MRARRWAGACPGAHPPAPAVRGRIAGRARPGHAAFEGDPRRFAPRYGGCCAWTVARGGLAPGVPDAWRIVEGALDLAASREVLRDRESDIPGFIAAADAHWPDVLG